MQQVANISKNLPSVLIRFYLLDLQVAMLAVHARMEHQGPPITSPRTMSSTDYVLLAPFSCGYSLKASAGHKIKITLASGANVQSGSLPLAPDTFSPGLAVSKYTTRNNILAIRY